MYYEKKLVAASRGPRIHGREPPFNRPRLGMFKALVSLFLFGVLLQQHGRSQQDANSDPCPESD
jgi:hypothetical protein